MEIVILFGMVIGLMLLGVPIAVSLGLSSILFLMVLSESSLASVAQTLFSAFEGHYTLLAIPFSFSPPALCPRVVSPGESFVSPLPWSVQFVVAWLSHRCLPA